MATSDIIDAAVDALGVVDAQPVTVRGQKHVLRGKSGERDVAIKLVVLTQLPDSDYVPVALERAEREVRFLLETDHPNVVSAVSDLAKIGDGPDAAAWLEEWIEGDDVPTLFRLPWDWPEAKRLAQDVARGLTAFHGCDVVHRDLSANNIRARQGGGFVVMDPGLARFIAESAVTGVRQPGTPGYLSPEHVLPGAQPIYASDIFCLGIVMFQALTGELPVPIPGAVSYEERLANGEISKIADYRDDLTESQRSIVDTCLQHKAPRRYPNASRLLEALESV